MRKAARIVLFGAIVAGLFAHSAPMQTAEAAHPPRQSTRTYSASSANIANPERGFYHYTETHYGAGRTYHPLNRTQLVRWRQVEKVTLAYRVFYLEGLRGTDAIPAALIQRIRADFRTARAAGIKLIVRFAYSAGPDMEPPYGDVSLSRVLRHIDQLAPAINDNVDVIETLQAGFIGLWGEWYYTDHFASEPSAPWRLTETDWTARGKVLRALLDSVPEVLVQVRYPRIKQRLLPRNDPAWGRVGIHNDCFLASDDDFGTFAEDSDRQWLVRETTEVPMGGETCAENAPRSLWHSARADMTSYHFTFLNRDYNPAVLNSWGSAGRAEAARRLGYRLRLTSGRFQSSARPGAALGVRLGLTNAGFAAPIRDRPVQLVLASANGTYAAELPLDVTSLSPGRLVETSAQVCAPRRAGTYELFLNLPDPAGRLARQDTLPSGESTNAAYAVRLANVGTWDPKRGWNSLRQRVKVTASAAASSAKCAIPLTRVS